MSKTLKVCKKTTGCQEGSMLEKITNIATSSFPPKPNRLPPSNNPKPYDTTS